MDKSPTWLRIAQIVLGVIAIALSGWVIANPVTTTLLYVFLLGFALLMTGISKIIEGVAVRDHTKAARAIGIVIGVISIGGGIFALVNPIAAVVTLLMIISLVILIHGLGLIATGIATKNSSRGSRIASIGLGVIAFIAAIVVVAIPELAIVMALILLSLGLLFNGIASIVSGIIGYKIARVKTE